jgi:hypothetical protein
MIGAGRLRLESAIACSDLPRTYLRKEIENPQSARVRLLRRLLLHPNYVVAVGCRVLRPCRQ